MHCVVTAGPTYEPLDNVRRLTNFSTGRLGCELAAFLTGHGHEVTLLIGEQATYLGDRRAANIEVFSTTADLQDRLARLAAKGVGAVFHAAAVSDFTFGKIWVRAANGSLSEVKSSKISTRQGTLLAELAPTPKIIAQLRKWYPVAFLVGWKFEVDGDHEAVLRAAKQQLADSLTDACVANGPAYGEGFGLVRPKSGHAHLANKSALFEALGELVHTQAGPDRS
jgi:phosphopantothenoylcysteine decarboxylase/phosphopantothenate--cysteine ligase